MLVFVWSAGRVELLVVSPTIVVVTAERVARSLVVAATVAVDVERAVDSLSHRGGISDTLTSDVVACTMVGGGAYEAKSQRDVYPSFIYSALKGAKP